jgi:hypothetical protein
MVPVKRHAYSGYGLEIRSGAYFYSLSALAEISHALHVLTSTYLIAVNDTTGFHVHVGDGLAGFGFDTMRRLLAFLWAFEPQLSSLHPPHRFNAQWARSLRYGSVYSRGFLDAQGRRPRALEGVSHFLRAPDWDALHRDASAAGHSRSAYRFDDLVLFGMEGPQANKDGDLKLTVEFRAHAGSVDAQEITNYVKTVVGIVAFVRDADAGALNDLLSVVEYESFDEDGRTREPVLAETEFTVVDLMRRIGLWEPARYYQERGIYKIRREGEDDEHIAPARTKSGCAAEGGWNRARGTGECDAWENDHLKEVKEKAERLNEEIEGARRGRSKTKRLPSCSDSNNTSFKKYQQRIPNEDRIDTDPTCLQGAASAGSAASPVSSSSVPPDAVQT